MVHRQSILTPSYYQTRKIIQTIPRGINTLAHEGKKEYSNKYDLVHLREADYQNQIWQADYTLLDIELINSKGSVERPWLTVILDAYSRAVSGYYVDFSAQNSTKTNSYARLFAQKSKNFQ